jgi:hypothetical protein
MKTREMALFISLLFILMIFSSISSCHANFTIDSKPTTVPSDLEITYVIQSPQNNSLYSSSEIAFAFNVSTPGLFAWINASCIGRVYYKASWENSTQLLYSGPVYDRYLQNENIAAASRERPTSFSYNETLSGVPDGNHSVTIIVWVFGGYKDFLTWYGYNGNFSRTINFEVKDSVVHQASGESFPALYVAMGSAALASVVSAGLLVFFRKRQRQAKQPY